MKRRLLILLLVFVGAIAVAPRAIALASSLLQNQDSGVQKAPDLGHLRAVLPDEQARAVFFDRTGDVYSVDVRNPLSLHTPSLIFGARIPGTTASSYYLRMAPIPVRQDPFRLDRYFPPAIAGALASAEDLEHRLKSTAATCPG